MNIFDASHRYEKWLSDLMPVREVDLELKHQRMREAAFPFLRATFYRWIQHWDDLCSQNDHSYADAPRVLAVGDLHIENFGTWRDLDGRLIWGVNDFDEAFQLPYLFDLVRLATSARLAIEAEHFGADPNDALEAILDGYERGLQEGGCPFVLEERHKWLRKLALGELREPAPFWKKMKRLEPAHGMDVASAKRAIAATLPDSRLKLGLYRRIAGLGSLGRPRIVGLADYGGGLIAREAKRVAPSAVLFARRRRESRSQHTQEIIRKSIRVSDPFYQVKGHWLVRRLAPHCSKIEVAHFPKKQDELALFEAMGFETANVHFGTGEAQQLLHDLNRRRRKDLQRAVDQMTELTLEDWNVWRRG